MRGSKLLVWAAILALLGVACGGQSGDSSEITTGVGEDTVVDEPGGVISFLGNAAMDEFLAAWNDYRTYYDAHLESFDPTTAASYEEFVGQARATSNEFLNRLERLAEAHAPLPPLFEAEIESGGIPEDAVEDVRELVAAYGIWIEYERKENEEFLDCLELVQVATLIDCMEESVTTTGAKGDDVARRIFELQETLYGVTLSPSA